MYYLIYKTTNVVNGKIYIGCHKTENVNDNYVGSGVILKKAIKKYGIDNFIKENIYTFDNEKDMFLKEEEIVDKNFIKRKDVYNIKTGGFGGWPDECISWRSSNEAKEFHKKFSLEPENLRRFKDNKKLKEWQKSDKLKELLTKYSKSDRNMKQLEMMRNSEKHKEWRNSDRCKEILRKANKEKKGKFRWVTNEIENKMIKSEELPIIEEKGWRIGRVFK